MQKPSGKRSDRASRLEHVARRRWGVLSAHDLRLAGLDRFAIRRREKAGLLHPMFPGTWSLGHRSVPREGWFMAAVLSAGNDARLDGPSACQPYGIHGRRTGRVHVVSAGRSSSRGRLVVRHANPLPPRLRHKGIPVVPVEEALLGLAASAAGDREVRRAIRQAQVDGLTTHERLREHVASAKGRPGIARFRKLVGDRAARTRSELEDDALDLLRRYGLDPRSNVVVDGQEADMVLDGLIIELDSETFHDNAVTAAEDRRRHERWHERGRPVERLTWDDVHVTPVATVRRLARASRATRSSPPRA